jgi:hypothetical protein
MAKKLPPNPNLDHLKKEAKKVLKAFQQKDPEGSRPLRSIRRFANLPDERFWKSEMKLADAQFAVALEYGFESWRSLSRQVSSTAGTAAQPAGTDKSEAETNLRFSRLHLLENRAIQRLLRETDSYVLANAMLGADEGLKQKIFLNMSRRASILLQEDITAISPTMHQAAIVQMRKMVLNIYDKLVKQGEIAKGALSPSSAVKPGIGTSASEPVEMLRKNPQVDRYSVEELKTLFTELAGKTRTGGILGLEADAELIRDDLVKKGLQLVIDGTDPKLIEKLLKSRLEKKLRETRTRYEALIEAVLSIQAGDPPQMVRERLDSGLT